MQQVQCLVPENFLTNFRFDETANLDGDEYFAIRVPSLQDVLNNTPVDAWDTVYIPEDMLTRFVFDGNEADYETQGYHCDVVVDGTPIEPDSGSLGDMSDLYSRFGNFGVITTDTDVLFPCRSGPDRQQVTMSCHELFSRLCAREECLLCRPDSEGVRQIYKSCETDYLDENPINRTIRSVRFGSTPYEDPVKYRNWYAAARDYSSLPVEAGFANLKHTVLNKSMIEPGIVDINGRPCRKVFVPTPSGFFGGNPEDPRMCDSVYIPAEYFADLPDDFGDFSLLGPDEPNRITRRPDAFKSQYAVCTLPVAFDWPADYPIFNLDGSQSSITPSVFSASMTCLTSGQFYQNNLAFDLDRFSQLHDMVMRSKVGGAFLNRLELSNDVPAVDFEWNDNGEIVLPSAEKIRDVRAKIDDFNREEIQRSAAKHAASEQSHNIERLNSRVNRNAGLKSLFNIMLRDRVNLKVATNEDAPVCEEVDAPDDLFVPPEVGAVQPVYGALDEILMTAAGNISDNISAEPVDDVSVPIPAPDIPPDLEEPEFDDSDIPGVPDTRDMSDLLDAAGYIPSGDYLIEDGSFDF